MPGDGLSYFGSDLAPIDSLRAAFGDANLTLINQPNTNVTTAAGPVLATWGDARGAGFGSAWTFTGSSRPTYTQNGAGIWVAGFDGVDDTSDDNAGLHSVFQNVGVGFIAVAAATGTLPSASVLVFVGDGATSNITRASCARDQSAGKVRSVARRIDGDASTTVDGGTSDTTMRDDLTAVNWTGGLLRGYQAGAERTGSPASLPSSGSTSNTASLKVTLGASAGSNFFKGDTAAVVIGTILPNASQIAALHSYMVAVAKAAA